MVITYISKFYYTSKEQIHVIIVLLERNNHIVNNWSIVNMYIHFYTNVTHQKSIFTRVQTVIDVYSTWYLLHKNVKATIRSALSSPIPDKNLDGFILYLSQFFHNVGKMAFKFMPFLNNSKAGEEKLRRYYRRINWSRRFQDSINYENYSGTIRIRIWFPIP